MTSATGADEVPFVSGMEREPPPVGDTLIEIGRKAWSLDGMLTRVLEKARSAMEARGDRGPDPDAVDDDEERILVPVRLLERFGRGGYREAPKDSNLKGVIIGCTISIVSAGIIGAIVLSNQFAALRAEFTEWKTATEYRLQQLERRP